MAKLKWMRYYDGEGGDKGAKTVAYFALYPGWVPRQYSDAPSPLYWGLRPIEENGRTYWQECHSPEILTYEPNEWSTLAEAKRDIQEAHDRLLRGG